MRYSIISSSSTDIDHLISDLRKKLNKIDFEPNLGIIVITQSLFGKHKKILNFLSRNLKFDTISFFTDGFGTREGIFMNGILILLLAVDYEIFLTGKGNLERELERIAGDISQFDVALAIYPALYFPRKATLIKGFLRDRFYWFRYRRCKNEECKRKILRKYSNWVQKERLFIPINKVLRVLGKSGIPIGSINLVPMEVHEDTPLILHNFKPIGRNVLVVGFRNADLDFKDIFPERGKDFEETREILKNFFAFKEEVTVLKEGNVIGEINGISAKDYIKEKFKMEIDEDDFIEKISKGELLSATPFGLSLISYETFGSCTIGLMGNPLSFYPYFIELDKLSDRGIVLGEIFVKNPEEFVTFEKLKDKNKVLPLIFIDSIALLAYHGEAYRIYEHLANYLELEWILFFSSFPSAYLNLENKKFLSEIEKNVYNFGSGTSFLLLLQF